MFSEYISMPHCGVAQLSIIAKHSACVNERLVVVNSDDFVKHPS